MTATPREPGEIGMSIERALQFADDRSDSNILKDMALNVLAREYRALLAQAPKVWAADTIKDAPEGWYFPGFGFEPHGWDCRTMAPLSRTKDLLAYYQNTGMRMMAWGPVSLPPPPEEKGG